VIAVIQRCLNSSVEVDGDTVGSIKNGLVIFLGILKEDNLDDAEYLFKKINTIRIFSDNEGKMNLSLKEVGGSVLIISQFTLCANVSSGRRPSFAKAKSPDESKILYEKFILHFKKYGVNVQTGQFGKFMNVKIINNGPSTFIFNSRKD
tara:strand:+ start:4119 stop:4565 length:447 start_codon:yes stop_codon:yes gene_type:complete